MSGCVTIAIDFSLLGNSSVDSLNGWSDKFSLADLVPRQEVAAGFFGPFRQLACFIY